MSLLLTFYEVSGKYFWKRKDEDEEMKKEGKYKVSGKET